MPSGRRDIPDKDDPRYVRPPDEAYELDDDSSYRQHQAVNNVITQRLIGRLTGRGPDEERHYGSKPSRQYFAGVLASQYEYREAIHEGDSFEDIAEDVAPFSVGLQFRVPATIDDDASVTISPQSQVYYRRFPTATEQKERGQEVMRPTDASQERGTIAGEGQSEDVRADGGSAAEEVTETQSLLPVYERLPVEFDEQVFRGDQLKQLASADEKAEIDLGEALDDATDVALSDDRYYCERATGVKRHEAREVPVDVVEDEETFDEWLDAHYSDDPVKPLWDAELRVQVEQEGDELVTNATLVNTHGKDYPEETDYEYKMWRAFLFDIGVEARTEETSVRPFQLDEIRDEYQYDGRMYAIGENCAAEPFYPEEARNPMADPDPAGVQTVTLPVYKQAKYLPRQPIPARFDILAGEAELDPSEHPDLDLESPAGLDDVLRLIEEEMEAAERDYEAIRDDVLNEKKSDEAESRFDDALEDFQEERRRFHQGRKLIENDDRVRHAFKLLNETFHNLGDFQTWRLFQVVFIVMTIPDMVKQADPDRDIETKLDTADVIYYPTGGGKTEAYLGLVTFTAFHDRLRGKHYGTTALTKFPLRFLSLDQLERAAEVLGQAELVRRDHGIEGEEFSVGYFVGSDNTPNKLMDEMDYDLEDNIKNAIESPSNEEEEHDFLIVTECPFCEKESVDIDGDHEKARVYHKCTNEECRWVREHGGGEAPLPIYITDREIYRFAPTFVVSTIDKISIMGMQRRFRTLLGGIQYRCPDHGFSGEDKCLVEDWDYPERHECDSRDIESVDPVEPPSLVIQDELHLLREEFGSFDSHYETLIQTLADRLNDGWDIKVVAATATIQGAERQVEALYRKEDNIFPAQGPRLKQSFYAYAHPRKVGRNMIGGIPRNVTRSRAINRIHEEQARIVQEFMDGPETVDAALREREASTSEFAYDELNLPSGEEARYERLEDVLDDYEVQISYHYAKDNTQLMKRSVGTMINGNLEAAPCDYHKLRAVLMTGETPLSLVRAYKNEIEKPRAERENPIHMVIATSMISHGIDIDRFNFIAFHGMPRSTAEYIQSYSRVGRDIPGTVYLSFNSMQVRDQSHYHQFHHYHEYEDLLVEATPLERWAKYAVEQTISGVLCGALLQYYDAEYADEIDGRLYDLEGLQDAIHDDLIDKQDVKEFVMEAYDVVDTEDDTTDAAAIYADRIDDLFDTLWRYLLSAEPERNTFIPSVLGEAQEDDSLPGVRSPMTNLRDIDEQVPIDPDTPTSKSVHLSTN